MSPSTGFSIPCHLQKKSTESIDGIVATVMGLGRTLLDEGECNPDVFLIPW